MKEPKFTNGPWTYLSTDLRVYAKGGIICKRAEQTGAGSAAKNWEQNAHLIAAAPELFEALKASPHELHPKIDGEECLCGQCEFVKLRDSALAKAMGEENDG